MLVGGFPADAQGNVSLGGEVSLVLAELLPFPVWLGKAGGFSPLPPSVFTFLEQVREMFPFPALHSGFCWGFLTGGCSLCPASPPYQVTLQFTCLRSCWCLSFTGNLCIYQEH